MKLHSKDQEGLPKFPLGLQAVTKPPTLFQKLSSIELSSLKVIILFQEFSYLWPKLDLVFDGGCLGGTEESRLGSTVVDLSSQGQYKIIRDGYALRAVEGVLNDKFKLICIS